MITIYDHYGNFEGVAGRVIELTPNRTPWQELDPRQLEVDIQDELAFRDAFVRDFASSNPTKNRRGADKLNRTTRNRNAHTEIPETDAERAGLTTKQKIRQLVKQMPGMVNVKVKKKAAKRPLNFSYIRWVDEGNFSDPQERELSYSDASESQILQRRRRAIEQLRRSC